MYAVHIEPSKLKYTLSTSQCYAAFMSTSKRSRRAAGRGHPYHHGALKQAALAQAHRILEKKGADAVTVRAIARGVGVTPNALYRHFQDKNALLATLAEEGFRELNKSFQRIAEGDARKRFREMAHCYVQFGSAKPAVLRLMFGQEIAKLPKRSGLREAAGEAFTALLQAAAAAAGLPPDSEDSLHLAIACWSLVQGYTTLLTRGALDFVRPAHRPRIGSLVRFIELDPRRWSSKSLV